MKLYLLRHADAATEAATDDERTLSTKGLKQGKCVARFCRQQGVDPVVILSSPLPRAQQTAKPVADKLGIKIETAPWLACGCEPEQVLRQLAERKEVSLMLVGHEPDFSSLVAALVGAGSEAIRVRKASLVLLEVTEFRPGGARLEWSVPVKMMERT
ncbi:MAG: phosphohistidine phosphatase SixA [Verrucomicrobiota bacterium]